MRFLVTFLVATLIPWLSLAEDKASFVLSDTVSLGLTCDPKAEPEKVQSKIDDPRLVSEFILGLVSCPSDNTVLSSPADVYVYLGDRHECFHKGYVHLGLKKVGFYTGKRAQFYSLDQKAINILLSVKSADCKR